MKRQSLAHASVQRGDINEVVESRRSHLPWSRCKLTYKLLPTGMLIFGMCLALVVLARRVGDSQVAEAARSVALFQQFVGLANYSAAIVDSYQLTMAVGRDAAASGRLIGLYMLGTSIGGVLMWAALKWELQIWKDWPRQILIASQFVNLLSFVVSVYTTAFLLENDADTFHPQAFALISACRCVSGIGHGVGAQLLQVSFAYLTPVPERPQQMVRFFFVNTLGIGLGPILAGGVRMLNLCSPGSDRFELSGLVQVVLSGTSLIGVAMFYPDLQAFDKTSSPPPSARGSNSSQVFAGNPKFAARRIRVCGCLLMALLRALVTSGVEGATSYLLESQYDWARHKIGIGIGLTFLSCIPAKSVLDCAKETSVLTKIRIMSFISIAGSALLYCAGPLLLIVADVLLFPSLYLSDGLARGLMQQYALPTGSMLDQNHTTLWAGILSNGVGRYLGPWLARLMIDKADQQMYCFMQLGFAACFLICFEVLVVEYEIVTRLFNSEADAFLLDEPPKVAEPLEVENTSHVDVSSKEPSAFSSEPESEPLQAAAEPNHDGRCVAS